jgi:hypothetical protein
MKVTVNDLVAKEKSTAKLERKFDVLDPKFGLVQLGLFNQGGFPAPPTGVVGQAYVVSGALVGFELDKDMLPNLSFELRILDEAGKPTLPKPFTGEVNKLAKPADKLMPLFFNLPLNRSGKFTLELEATDKFAKKTVKQTLTINVIEPK